LPNATSIGASAFRESSSLTSVSLPNATSIGDNAFDNCTSLASVLLPNATSIGVKAFQNCISLTSIFLPDATIIGASAFFGCSELVSADLPKITTLVGSVFDRCIKLSSISLPIITSIAESTFQNIGIAMTIYTLSTNQYFISNGTNRFYSGSVLRYFTIITNFYIPEKTCANGPFQIIDPSSNSTAGFTYTSSNPKVANVQNNIISIIGVGKTIITARQAATIPYTDAYVTTVLIVTQEIPIYKKWVGGNRDASQTAERRRVCAIDLGSMKNTCGASTNTVNDALRRVRGGGSVAPPKKAASPSINPTPHFAPAVNKTLYGFKNPYLYH